MAFYEIRHYQTRPGRREEWVPYMEDVVIPYMIAQGMSVTASFVDEEDDDGYVWIRRFEDEAQRVALYAAVYESARWTDEIAPVVGELLDAEAIKVTRVRPTPAAPLR